MLQNCAFFTDGICKHLNKTLLFTCCSVSDGRDLVMFVSRHRKPTPAFPNMTVNATHHSNNTITPGHNTNISLIPYKAGSRPEQMKNKAKSAYAF